MTPTNGRAEAADVAAGLRGFGPTGLLALLLIFAAGLVGPPASAILVLLWARWSGTPMRALGFIAPRRWPATVPGAIAIGVVLKLVMKALVMPLLGAPAVNARYHGLAGNAAALPGMIAVVLIGAGFSEEVFFRGYLFERLSVLLGRGRIALATTVLLSTALFAVAHAHDQGLAGVEQAAVTGLVLGVLFARRRQLWSVMIVHAAFDLAAVALIYWNLESAVAHFFFR